MFVGTESPSWENSKWSAGAGPVDSVRATGDAIQTEDWGEFAASAGILALDGFMVAVDPIGTALAAGVGWLMEHFAPLRELLDLVAGDPNAIREGADTWNEVKADLKSLADEFREEAGQQTSSWSGPAKDAYTKQVKEYVEGLEGMSMSAGNASAVIATSGTMVATCRAIIRDIVAAIVAELIKGALAALASSVVSFGATVAGYLAYATGRIGMTISKIVTKISQLLAKLGKAGGLLARCMEDMAKIGSQVGADLTTAGTKAASTNPAMAGEMVSAGTKASADSAALGATASGTARVSDGVTSAAGYTADAASGLGRASENLAGTGLRWGHAADDVGEAAGKRVQSGVDNFIRYRGSYSGDLNQAGNILESEGYSLRTGLGAGQYHEQNYDSDDGGGHYDVDSSERQNPGSQSRKND